MHGRPIDEELGAAAGYRATTMASVMDQPAPASAERDELL